MLERQLLIDPIMLLEYDSSGSLLITESVNYAPLAPSYSQDGKDCWLVGTFMQSAKKNRNGRIYQTKEVVEQVDYANNVIRTSASPIIGELDHPAGLTINLDRVSHAITEMTMQQTDAVGRAKILPTPCGNIARILIDSQVKLGVSSRGAGFVAEGGIVQDFKFLTVDIVAQPSAPGAVPKAVYESVEQASNGKHITTLAEAVVHDKAAQKYLIQEIQKFLRTDVLKKR